MVKAANVLVTEKRGLALKHVTQSSKRCGDFYLENVYPMTVDELEVLDREFAARAVALRKQGHRRHKAELLAHRVEGPLWPP